MHAGEGRRHSLRLPGNQPSPGRHGGCPWSHKSVSKHLPAACGSPGCAGTCVTPTMAASSGCITSTATSCCAGPCWEACPPALLGPAPAGAPLEGRLPVEPALSALSASTAPCRRRRQGQVMVQLQSLHAAQKSRRKTRMTPPAVALHAMATAEEVVGAGGAQLQAGRQTALRPGSRGRRRRRGRRDHILAWRPASASSAAKTQRRILVRSTHCNTQLRHAAALAVLP